MFLFKVENVFMITGWGLILVPGLGDKYVKAGSAIKLVRPDGSILRTKITGIIFESHDISIGRDIEKKDVPIGTEVWLDE